MFKTKKQLNPTIFALKFQSIITHQYYIRFSYIDFMNQIENQIESF